MSKRYTATCTQAEVVPDAAADRYLARLAPIVEGKTDVVGYTFAINGKLYTADFYGSPALFRKVWPRLINATAIEAFADLQKDKTFPAVTVANVKAFLEEAEKGTAESKEVSKEIRQVTNATAKVVRIETKAGAAKDATKKDGGDTVRTSILAR